MMFTRPLLLASFLYVFLLLPHALSGEPIPVKYREGAVHGFLSLRTLDGKVLATGDLIQTVQGDRGISRLTFRFKDGSIDDETAVFTQRGHFRLIRDHHVQRGPAFPKSTDVLINATNGQVTVRYKDKGEMKVETKHMDLPPDLANGIILDVVKNVSPDDKETKMSYLAADPKPQLVQLVVTPQGSETFSVANAKRKAIRFAVKVELGGLKGVIAPMIGKQPDGHTVWISAGQVPAFVKSEGPLYLSGPVWSIEMTSPVWNRPQVKKE